MTHRIPSHIVEHVFATVAGHLLGKGVTDVNPAHFEPAEEVSEKLRDTGIVASDAVKQIFALLQQCEINVKQINQDVVDTLQLDPPTRIQIVRERQKIRLLSAMLEAEILALLPDAHPHKGYRLIHGWKIVEFEPWRPPPAL